MVWWFNKIPRGMGPCQPESAFPVSPALPIIPARQISGSRQYSQDYSKEEDLTNFLPRGFLWALHALRLGPVTDEREENRLAVPRSRFHMQRSSCPWPGSGPGHTRRKRPASSMRAPSSETVLGQVPLPQTTHSSQTTWPVRSHFPSAAGSPRNE